AAAFEVLQRFGTGFGADDTESFLIQEVPDGVGVTAFIFDKQDRGHGCGPIPSRVSFFSRGTVTVKTEPAPGALSADTVPPWLAAMCLTMDSPSPEPPVVLPRDGSTR